MQKTKNISNIRMADLGVLIAQCRKSPEGYFLSDSFVSNGTAFPGRSLRDVANKSSGECWLMSLTAAECC